MYTESSTPEFVTINNTNDDNSEFINLSTHHNDSSIDFCFLECNESCENIDWCRSFVLGRINIFNLYSIKFLKIDATNFEYGPEKEDLIELQLKSEAHVEVCYSKLVKESKYVRDKYKYSEAKNYIQQEIIKLEKEYQISDEGIKSFFQLIEEEKVIIRLEIYKDIYTLCKYFNTIKYKKILDKIIKEELFSDLDFTIEILHSSIGAKSDNEIEITAKIENYLSLHVNECINKKRFGELPISTFFRIIQKSTIEKVDMTSLVDFIIKSAATRLILFKFVLLHKVETAKIDEFIDFIDE